MPIFYEEITIDAKLTKEQCYSVQNFEVVVPRGKRIKLRKPLQTDVFFITENENIIGPLRSKNTTRLHSWFGVKERLFGNLADVQLGIVDGSNHVLDLEFVYRFIFKIKDKFWGDEDYLEVVAQVTMETNYHVSDSKMLLQMFVERRLGCPADDIRKYVEREVTKRLCEERTMELNDDPIEFISDKFGKVAETIETSLQECSVSYLQIDDIKCKITCENQEELIVNFNQIKDKIRERITELQNVLLEMIKIVSEKPVLSDSVCSILTETAKINDTLSLKQLVDEFVKIEGDHGAEQALASVQKLLSSWRID